MQEAGITLSTPSFKGNSPEEQGFAGGEGLSDNFKMWLNRHPGLSIDEAHRRYRDDQKAKQKVRQGPKISP